jgi:hypothetical protein
MTNLKDQLFKRYIKSVEERENRLNSLVNRICNEMKSYFYQQADMGETSVVIKFMMDGKLSKNLPNDYKEFIINISSINTNKKYEHYEDSKKRIVEYFRKEGLEVERELNCWGDYRVSWKNKEEPKVQLANKNLEDEI